MIQLTCQSDAPLSYPCPVSLWWPYDSGIKSIVAELLGPALMLYGTKRELAVSGSIFSFGQRHFMTGAFLTYISIENRKSTKKKASECANSILKDLFHSHGICARTNSIREQWARMETPAGQKDQVMAICGLTGPESFGGARTSNSTASLANKEMTTALSLLEQRLKSCTNR